MTARDAITKYVNQNCYLGITISPVPASLVWEIVRQRERIKTLDLVIASQNGMASILIG